MRVWVHRKVAREEMVMLEGETAEQILAFAKALPNSAWTGYLVEPYQETYGLGGVSLSDERKPYNEGWDMSHLREKD